MERVQEATTSATQTAKEYVQVKLRAGIGLAVAARTSHRADWSVRSTQARLLRLTRRLRDTVLLVPTVVDACSPPRRCWAWPARSEPSTMNEPA